MNKNRDGRLIFAGRAAADLLRKVVRLPQKPVLVVHCQRGPGLGAGSYEAFEPTAIAIKPAERLVIIQSNHGTVYWHPDRPYAESGDYVSSVAISAGCFRTAGLDNISLDPIGF
jgi:hypothetical protein